MVCGPDGVSEVHFVLTDVLFHSSTSNTTWSVQHVLGATVYRTLWFISVDAHIVIITVIIIVIILDGPYILL